MEFLAGTWWIWLIVAVVFWTGTRIYPIYMVRKMWESFPDWSDNSFFSGIIFLIIIFFVGSISSILFVVGVISNFLR